MNRVYYTGQDLLELIRCGKQPERITSSGGLSYEWNAKLDTYIIGSEDTGFSAIWAGELAKEMFFCEVDS